MVSVATSFLVVFNLVPVTSFTWAPQRGPGHAADGGGGPLLHRSLIQGDSKNGPFASKRPPNLIYIKVPKAASSTTGGVVRRIAARHGLGCAHDYVCDWSSEPSVSAYHRERLYMESLGLKQPTVWVASIRDPLSRCMSMFYHFQAGRYNVSNTAENKIKYLNSSDCRNYQWNFMCPLSICKTNNTEKAINNTEKVIDAYSFIVLVERFEESMSLLIRTLGLSTTDALYLGSKNSSTFPVPHRNFEDEPAEVQAFVGNHFKAQNQLDYKLWEIVNDRMNTQMQDQRNKDLFVDYTKLLHKATSTCSTKCTWNVGLNAGENCEDCYWHDNGCGYSCFDALDQIR